MKVITVLLLTILLPVLSWSRANESATVDSDGFRVHRLVSPHQVGDTTVRLLLPDRLDKNKQYRVLYVLPVVAEAERRFWDGLLEMKKYDYHNTHQLICVASEFTTMPWFADHDLNPEKQDESHFLKTVLAPC
ncbi:MAG: hypothetical protein O7C75_12175 [Verrucomicrobia bacterium]|nr:hypothetical protein [Verrucomicrobiota bacterium]